jgi:hypothetical protein
MLSEQQVHEFHLARARERYRKALAGRDRIKGQDAWVAFGRTAETYDASAAEHVCGVLAASGFIPGWHGDWVRPA